MAILDQYGRPLQRETLKTPQTARTVAMARTWATHPSRGLSIGRLPLILEAAERGDLTAQADLFEDMIERDGHIFSEMAKRKNALLTLDWSIEPPDNATAQEKSHADMVADWIKNIPNLEDVTLNAAEAIGHGFAAQEIEKWTLEDKVWLPEKIELRPHRWFNTLPDKGNQLRLCDGSSEGAELQAFGWLVHCHNAKSGWIAQSGLYRVLVWPYLFKNYSLRDMAEFLEIYGLPARIGKLPTGSSDSEEERLMQALQMLGHNASGIISGGTEIEFKSAADGQSDPFMAMIDWAERTESKVILGGTLTSQADGKSSTNALGNVHNEVRHDLLTADARQLEGFYAGTIRMLLAINGHDVSPRRQPKLKFDTAELEDIQGFSEGVSNLVARAGLTSIPASWVHKKLGIPQPREDEPVLTAPVATSPVALSTTAPATGKIAALTALNDAQQEALDAAVPAGDAIAQAMTALVAPLVDALREGSDPDNALNRVAASYPALDDAQLQQLMVQALFVADVWGRLHAGS
ncbi:DUF935 domain-containing protein [Erwinia psidii]|uniref:DUF935 domain-containing protein n=1 Tax=Erwinia psidii TaxID=69224 RepID=UPI00226B3D51|nr:DUF935 domain-containing protein [Erwinia psidii]MCX8962146.1 DUF935 domain-containing protein [Erwinia psidii]